MNTPSESSYARTIALALAVVLLAGCVQVQHALERAKASVEAVQKDEADIYLPEKWTKLNKDLTLAMDEIGVQERKIIGSYKVAKKMLEKVLADAETIRQSLPDLKGRVRQQAETVLTKAGSALEQAQEVHTRLLLVTQDQQDNDSYNTGMAILEMALADARKAIEHGDLNGALRSGRSIREDADHFSLEMKRTIRKFNRAGQLSSDRN